MKKVIVVVFGFLVSLLLVGGAAYAHQGPNDKVEKMKTELSLTDAQAEAVRPIIEEYSAKRKKLKANLNKQGAKESSINEQMEQLKKEKDEKLGQILDKDQRDKLKKTELKLGDTKKQKGPTNDKEIK